MDLNAVIESVKAAVSQGGSMSDAAGRVVVAISEALQTDGATMTLVDGDYVRYIAAMGSVAKLYGQRRPLKDSFTGDIVLGRRGKVFLPDRERATSRGRASLHSIACGMIVPVLRDGFVVGTLGVTSTRAEVYNQTDVDHLAQLAELVVGIYELPDDE